MTAVGGGIEGGTGATAVCRRGSLVLTHTHTQTGSGSVCVNVCECVARLFDKWQQFFLHIFFMLFALLSFQLAVFSAAVSLFALRQACLSVRLSVCVCVFWLILWGLLPTVCPLMKLLIFVSKVTYTMC